MAAIEIVVPDGQGGVRLDRFLAGALDTISRSAIQKLIASGRVQVDGELRRASYTLSAGEFVTAEISEAPVEATAQGAPLLSVLYEDSALNVIDKPAGLVVHQAAGQRGLTLVDALLAHRPSLADAGMDPLRPGIVHRLDRDTSGVIVVAGTASALSVLQREFRRRQVRKEYLALVHGTPSPARAAIEAPIGRDPANRVRMAVVPEGRYARTEYEVVERYKTAALLSIRLLTGRTHQIRVHMKAIGHPVVGDRVYGPTRDALEAPRQMLHSCRLSFEHPVSGLEMTFEAPVPPDMAQLIRRLQGS